MTRKDDPAPVPPGWDEDDWAMVHYATGILLGVGHKYGVVDVTIYHDDVRVQITPGVSKHDSQRAT